VSLVESATCKNYLQGSFWRVGREVLAQSFAIIRLEAVWRRFSACAAIEALSSASGAIGRLNEYLVKGFTIERRAAEESRRKCREPYFDELLDAHPRIARGTSASIRRYWISSNEWVTTADGETTSSSRTPVQTRMHWRPMAIQPLRSIRRAGGRDKAIHGHRSRHTPRHRAQKVTYSVARTNLSAR